MTKRTMLVTTTKKNFLKPNYLGDLWGKWGKEEMRLSGKHKGYNKEFSHVINTFFDIVLDEVVNNGNDVYIPNYGTIAARQVSHTSFRNKRYGRIFTYRGGREYTIHDLMKKGNRYPTITFIPALSSKVRRVYWRVFLRLSNKWAEQLYINFYDKGMEYKELIYLSEAQWKKKNEKKKIWRSGMLVKVK